MKNKFFFFFFFEIWLIKISVQAFILISQNTWILRIDFIWLCEWRNSLSLASFTWTLWPIVMWKISDLIKLRDLYWRNNFPPKQQSSKNRFEKRYPALLRIKLDWHATMLPNSTTRHTDRQRIQWNIRVKIADESRFYIIKELTKGCHLLDPRWNGLFLILCQRDYFHPLGNRLIRSGDFGTPVRFM